MKWFYELTPEALQEEVETQGLKKYVAGQAWQWIYGKNRQDMASWTDISKTARTALASLLDTTLNETAEVRSDGHGTRKYLFRLHDGVFIESVFMAEKKHFTFCISSQVGCPLGCKFCATGAMGFIRNLTAGEIISQILVMKKDLPAEPDPGAETPTSENGKSYQGKLNLVFMGMGEPLLNYSQLKKALLIITDPRGMAISPRNITVSTAGILEPLRKLEQDFPNIKISFSLNAPDAAIRESLMPISRKEKLDSFLNYFVQTGRKRRVRVTMEYVLIHNVNDAREHAARLVKMLHGAPCKINLIPYNPVANADFQAPGEEAIELFADYLLQRGFTVIVRWSKGRDIKSACGQLAALSPIPKGENPKEQNKKNDGDPATEPGAIRDIDPNEQTKFMKKIPETTEE